MAKKTVSVQGLRGETPIQGKVTNVGVSGFDHASIAAESVVDDTIAFLNWDVAQAGAKGEKLKGIIKAISTLTSDGHDLYRRKLATIREVAKGATDTAKEDAELMGYSASSFNVMLSNFAALSKAFQAGWAYDENLGWVASLKIAREYSKAQAMRDGKAVETKGRKVKVELGVVDKIMHLIGELNEAEMQDFAEKLNAKYKVI